MSAADDPSDLRVVGRVVKVHGLRGELVVEPSTDEVESRFAPGSRLRLPDGGFLTVVGARWHSGRLLVAAEEVPDRDAAERLRRVTLSAPPSDSAPDDPDEFHDHQLEGLRAELADGTVVGTVTAVDHGAGGELLVIDRDGSELLVPFVRAIVPTVDVPGGRVVLDPPDGLLDPE
ncbi:ribosome maturation factor RimM [Actinomycetospora soli]|uniref:ribosome maturation factor RimM n=1 Tax=Actinomycetospora soli TaxID=2893887 RepID=UPI001E3B0E1E|nr:ribosome maturation factor RimM [Actinomycetospora soli]MCD2191671.1 ribosome maturation factor RimM [Actinomycetospora soli]